MELESWSWSWSRSWSHSQNVCVFVCVWPKSFFRWSEGRGGEMLQLPSRGVFVVCFLLCLFCFNIEIDPTKWTAFAALALECILKQLRSAYFYVFFCIFFMRLLCLLVVVFLLFFYSTEFQKFQQFLFASTRHLALWTAHVCARVCVSGVCGCPYVCIINQIFYIHLCVCLSVICMCFFHSLSAFYLCLSRFDVALSFVHLCLRVGHGPWVPRIGFPFN